MARMPWHSTLEKKNKSSRALTIDAFSQIMVVFLVVLYYHYLDGAQMVIPYCFTYIQSWLKMVLVHDINGWTDKPSYIDARMHLKIKRRKRWNEVRVKSNSIPVTSQFPIS